MWRRTPRPPRPYRDYVLLRPRPDVLALTTPLALEMDEAAIRRAEQLAVAGGGQRWNRKAFEIGAAGKTADPNGFMFGEVVQIGPGNPSLSECRPQLRPGDVVGFSRFRIAHELRRGDGDSLLFVHEHGTICRVDAKRMVFRPLMNWVLTRRDADAFQRALERKLPMTDIELSEGVATNHHQRPDVHHGSKHAKPGDVVDSKVRMVVERVVQTGPGRWVQPLGLPRLVAQGGEWYDTRTGETVYKEPRYEARRLAPVWVPNQCARGEVVGFLKCGSSIPLYIKGQHLSLTPWGEFVCGFDLDDDVPRQKKARARRR